MSSESLHERFEDLLPATRDMHRALVSLMEELEAIDWYQQRVDGAGDADLKAVLAHNRDEEIEHAMMVLEWIRRHNPVFDDKARTYLFTTAPIVAVEEEETKLEAAGGGEVVENDKIGTVVPKPGVVSDGSLGIGSLKLA